MINIILWIIFGGLVGWIASLLMKTDAQQGILLNVVVGIVGAVIGGGIMNLIGGVIVTGFNLYSFVVSLLGAIVFLWVLKVVRA